MFALRAAQSKALCSGRDPNQEAHHDGSLHVFLLSMDGLLHWFCMKKSKSKIWIVYNVIQYRLNASIKDFSEGRMQVVCGPGIDSP
jgi:hypothetical protein